MIPLYSRHFCVRCDQRVFPYDSLERRTEAPQPGVRGKRVLLTSTNARLAQRDDYPVRIAWCWSCNRWTETYRETLNDIIRRYEERDGVTTRGRRRRRRAAKVLHLPRRRSA